MTAADIATEKTSVDDRLLVMLFLAGLFHLIIILGVTFAAPRDADSRATPTLEVLLVSDALPESAENDDARYLSQRTQRGSGNMREDARSQMPAASNSPIDRAGEIEGRSLQEQATGLAGGESSVLAASQGSTRRTFAADAEHAAQQPADAPRPLFAGAETNLPSSEDDSELLLRGPSQRELMVTANTRASAVAVYLDAWKRKVERVGTLNFPNQARRRGMSGSPVVEVALAADGRLIEVRVRKSSGHAELDRATVDILKLAAPFEPFPRDLAAQRDLLRFAYEWQFVGGQLAGSSVRMPAATR
jgi:protein TonB